MRTSVVSLAMEILLLIPSAEAVTGAAAASISKGRSLRLHDGGRAMSRAIQSA